MGQKVHPESMRVGYIHDWKSSWFNEKQFSEYLMEDLAIRDHIEEKLGHAGLSEITIRKDANEVEVNINTARPGIVIGKGGSEVDALRRELQHREALLVRGVRGAAAVIGKPRGQEHHALQVESLGELRGEAQVPEVDRIERAAEETEWSQN